MSREVDGLPERFTETDDVFIRIRGILLEECIRTNGLLKLLLSLQGRGFVVGVDTLQDIVFSILLDDIRNLSLLEGERCLIDGIFLL